MQQQHANDNPMKPAEREAGFSLASTLAQYEVEELLPGQAARLLNGAFRRQPSGQHAQAAEAAV
jgi:hypothetical protein